MHHDVDNGRKTHDNRITDRIFSRRKSYQNLRGARMIQKGAREFPDPRQMVGDRR